LYQHIEPGRAEFTSEREKAEVPARLERMLVEGKLPLAPDFAEAPQGEFTEFLKKLGEKATACPTITRLFFETPRLPAAAA
jgi:hypothetical protein